MAVLQGAVLPQGSLILVTGANGYVGSHVIDQFLKHKYRVRGLVRDIKKSAWVATYFHEHYGADEFELVEAKDLTDVDVMKKALEGCAGCAAVASDVSFSVDTDTVVGSAIKLVQAALEAAAATPSVKRVVLTSSSSAVPSGAVDTKFNLTEDSYNTESVEAAYAPEPHKPDHAVSVYATSKVKQEQEFWKFMKERKPGFVANTVLPDYVLGTVLNVEKQGFPSSVGIMKTVWDGDMAMPSTMLPPQYEIDAADCAMLHVAAMLHPDAQGERVFGFAHVKTWTDTVKLLRELYPDRQFPDPPEGEGDYLANVIPRPRAEELLKWVKGSGWASYKESLKLLCDNMV